MEVKLFIPQNSKNVAQSGWVSEKWHEKVIQKVK